MKGEARLARGDRAGAEQAFEAAIAADGRLTRVQFILANLHEQAGDYDKAIARYRAILVAAPDNVLALNNLAYALAVRKHAVDEALPLAIKAHQLSKGQPHIADTLGWIQHLLGNRNEAEKLLIAARDGAPNLAEVRLHLAAVYAAAGEKQLAITELRRGLELDPVSEKSPEVEELKRTLGIP
jgi:tetratricopeptide (TPR) repeat protein